MFDVLNAKLKIIVSGPARAGKSAFIQSVNEILTGCQVTTLPDGSADLAYRYGGIPVPDTDETLFLIETPSTEPPARNLWPLTDASGLVYVVDSTASVTFHEACTSLQMIDLYAPFPVVIAANKQDYNLPPDTYYGSYPMGHHVAWSPSAIGRALDIPPGMSVMPCVATDRENVKRVLIRLLMEIIAAMDTTW